MPDSAGLWWRRRDARRDTGRLSRHARHTLYVSDVANVLYVARVYYAESDAQPVRSR
jgi:hypothetical protein